MIKMKKYTNLNEIKKEITATLWLHVNDGGYEPSNYKLDEAAEEFIGYIFTYDENGTTVEYYIDGDIDNEDWVDEILEKYETTIDEKLEKVKGAGVPHLEYCYDINAVFGYARDMEFTGDSFNDIYDVMTYSKGLTAYHSYDMKEIEIEKPIQFADSVELTTIRNGSDLIYWIDENSDIVFTSSVHYMELEEQDEDGYNVGGDVVCCDM